jgi:hypothetical protein
MSLESPAMPLENAALNTAILERGVFYYPAGLRYGNPEAGVNCDRRTGIPACIGFDRYDYCLPCVNAVVAAAPAGAWRSHTNTRPLVNTYMAQNKYIAQDNFLLWSSPPPPDAAITRPPATRMMDVSIYRRLQRR